MRSAEPSRPLVLVVEDSQDLLVLYELILSDAGYRVATAPEGRSGLDLACRLRPAVVLLDMMMPDMDGLEFLRRLPACGPPVPPVVVSSGFEEFRKHARALGARAFLSKPVTLEELLAAIERALAGHAEPSHEHAQAERVAAGREQAHREREQLWARLNLDDPELRTMLDGVVAWLSRYFGFGTGLVDLLCKDRIFVEAGMATRLSLERDLAFCSEVIDAGSSLVISNTEHHPVFAEHKASAYWGTRFYVGCPITMSSGLVVGTVCLIDSVPRRISVGDMRVLEYLARRIAEHFEALADGRQLAPFFEPPALFERMAAEVVLDAHLMTAADADLTVAKFGRAGAEPRLLRRAAAAMQEAVTGARFAASRRAADTLAFVCGGAHPSVATEHALTALHEAGLSPSALGVAQCRLVGHRRVSASEVIGRAETACARSAAASGTPVHTVIPAPDRDSDSL